MSGFTYLTSAVVTSVTAPLNAEAEIARTWPSATGTATAAARTLLKFFILFLPLFLFVALPPAWMSFIQPQQNHRCPVLEPLFRNVRPPPVRQKLLFTEPQYIDTINNLHMYFNILLPSCQAHPHNFFKILQEISALFLSLLHNFLAPFFKLPLIFPTLQVFSCVNLSFPAEGTVPTRPVCPNPLLPQNPCPPAGMPDR